MISDYRRYRIYEMLPGISIWVTLLLPIFLSFTKPLIVIYLIIAFDIYWVIRVGYFSSYLILSWKRFHKSTKTNWMQKLKDDFLDWDKKKNVVFLPIYNESAEVVKTTLNAILESTYPAKKIYIVISGEERQLEHWSGVQEEIRKMYDGKFADLIFYTHPKDLEGEIPGKGSNIHYVEKEFKKYVDNRNWDYVDIIVSVFDIDTVVHPQYFSHLNFMYLSHPNPSHSSFQPVTLYNNNLWESPSLLRISALGTSFWMLFSLARLDNLVTFSSHSMSFKAIVDCGGHAKNIVSEDSRIFYQCWFHYNGDYEVTPLYIPVAMDTVRDSNIWKSLKNLYTQQRRWAWGSENIPYLLWQFRQNKNISKWKKFVILFHEWEGKWSWAVVAILITILGRLPLFVAGDGVRQSALFFNAPFILEILMILAMTGLFLSVVMTMLVLPRRPKIHPPHKYLYMVLQWILVPVSLIIFSAIPCIDAVTRLMFGKYLGFNVSAKKRN